MSQKLISVDDDGKKWFSELNSQWPGQCFSLQMEEMLLDVKTKWQHLQVFKSSTYGNVLVLDGVIQLTERDEMAYQEMIAHIPLFAHEDPKAVLIVGGGDGGVIREVVKHKNVERIVICEIDEAVINAGKKYFPSVASAWDDPRVEVVTSDASLFIKDPTNHSSFDVIICDTSDPVGPAEALFEMPFFHDMMVALRPGGRVSTQAETVWVHLPLIEKLIKGASLYFEHVQYATTQIPSYPCGMIGFLCCTKAREGERLAPSSVNVRPGDVADMKLRYYSTDMHQGAFVLPKFAQNALKPTLYGKTSVEVTTPFAVGQQAKARCGVLSPGRLALGLCATAAALWWLRRK